MRLHYLVKLRIRVFVKILMLEKWNSRNMANLIKLYQNRTRFVKDIAKYFGAFFRFTVLTTVHLQNVNAKFHKVRQRHYSGEAETFTFLYDKFTQNNMHQILSQSVRFCTLYIKKHFGVFFGSQCIYTVSNSISLAASIEHVTLLVIKGSRFWVARNWWTFQRHLVTYPVVFS